MNKKHKHKQTNPVPPTKQVIEEKESELDLEKRVPEIVTEVLREGIETKQELEVDTPNKPKRNRRKKKNEQADIEEKTCKEDVVQTITEQNTTKDANAGEQVYKGDVISTKDAENIDENKASTPTLRKKKNKNKSNENKELKETNNPVRIDESIENKQIKNEEIAIIEKTPDVDIQIKKKNKNKKSKKGKGEPDKESDLENMGSKGTNTNKCQEKENIAVDEGEKPEVKTMFKSSAKKFEDTDKETISKDNTGCNEKDTESISKEIKGDLSKSKRKNKKKRYDSERTESVSEQQVNKAIEIDEAKKPIDLSNMSEKNIFSVISLTKEKPSENLSVTKSNTDDTTEIQQKMKEVPINSESEDISHKSKKKNKKKTLTPADIEMSSHEETKKPSEIDENVVQEVKYEEKNKKEIIKTLKVETEQGNMNIKTDLFQKEQYDKIQSGKGSLKSTYSKDLEKNKKEIIETLKVETEQGNLKIKTDLIQKEQYDKNQSGKESLKSTDSKDLVNVQPKIKVEAATEHKTKTVETKVTKKQNVKAHNLHTSESKSPLQAGTVEIIKSDSVKLKDNSESEKLNEPINQKSDKIDIEIESAKVQDNKSLSSKKIDASASQIDMDKDFMEKHDQVKSKEKNKKSLSVQLKSSDNVQQLQILEDTAANKSDDMRPEQFIIQSTYESSVSGDYQEAFKDINTKSKTKNKKNKHILTQSPQQVDKHKTVTSCPEDILASDDKLEKKTKTLELNLQENKVQDEINTGDIVPDSVEFQRSASESNMLIDPNNNSNTFIEEIATPELSVQTLDVPITLPDTPFMKDLSDLPSNNNSNTFIEEIATPELSVQTLDVPIALPDTPFIKGLSDLHSPIAIISKSTSLDIEKSQSVVISEKTDLKSKVIEVNQDMEELRLSIEKSLAELTCMEQSEQIPEIVKVQSSIDENVPFAEKLDNTTEVFEKKDTDIKTIITDDKKTVQSSIDKNDNVSFVEKLVKTTEMFEIKDTENKKINTEDKKTTQSMSLYSNTFDMFPKFKTLEELEGKDQPVMGKSVVEENKPAENKSLTVFSQDISTSDVPTYPVRKDKGKGKSSKKKIKSEAQSLSTYTTNVQSSSATEPTTSDQQHSKGEQKVSESQQKQKQTDASENVKKPTDDENLQINDEDNFKNKEFGVNVAEQENSKNFKPIEHFEDAMTSSSDDVNQTFELIAEDLTKFDNLQSETSKYSKDHETKIDEKKQKENPLVSHPKNLLGHPDIPVRSNRIDYKKEKSKPPNSRQAKVRIKDVISPEKATQTENPPKIVITKPLKNYDPYTSEDYVYKYSFRNVFLPHVCHVCKMKLDDVRVCCNYCNLFFYCSSKHKEDDWPHHQALCFAVSTIVHLKGEKYMYADAKDVSGMNYRLLRMQMIVSCEKIVKRRLVPWEQEALLYPRMCALPLCREWKQNCLKDCEACGQIAYCKDHPDHFPKSHLRWCKSYNLYQKLVIYQQTKGRLEPRLPTKVITNTDFEVPDKMNELLATMYKEKIEMDDLQYAALTQLATAPLTAAYAYQVYTNVINSNYANGNHKKSSFTVHVVGAELQFEADALNKWEIFFLHLKPDVKELNVVLIGSDLNPSNLPLELLAKIKLCENCRQSSRTVVFNFYDKQLYHEYTNNEDFTFPDIVCAFNPSLNRSLGINGKDCWPLTVNSILKLRTPFCVTAYTPEELPKDLARIKQYANMDYKIITEPSHNPYASIRPDRNFISDDEMPLLFKNYSYAIICGQY